MISVHRLVQEVTPNRLDSAERDEWQKAALSAVDAIFPGESYDVRTWSTCTKWLGHALCAAGQLRSGELAPAATFRLLNVSALHLQSRDNYALAEPLYRRALEIGTASFVPNHPHVARDLNNLAALVQATNRLSEAEPLYRRALGILEASLGAEHPNSLKVRGHLEALLAGTARETQRRFGPAIRHDSRRRL